MDLVLLPESSRLFPRSQGGTHHPEFHCLAVRFWQKMKWFPVVDVLPYTVMIPLRSPTMRERMPCDLLRWRRY